MGNMEMTKEEREFHRSRLMWAFVNGELYWTYSEDGHREWLDKTFGCEYNFADITRGYIRKDIDDDIVYVVAYKDDFHYTDLSYKQLKLLAWIADLNYSYNKLKIFSGVVPGEPGQIWEPRKLIIEISRENNKSKQVALLDLLTYEKFIINLLNREDKYLSERRDIENEYYNLKDWLRGYYNMNVTTLNGLVRRAYS